jgi:hypothetical protein
MTLNIGTSYIIQKSDGCVVSVETFFSSDSRYRDVHECESKAVAVFSDEKLLWDLSLLCDNSHQLNDLEISKSKVNSNISDMYVAVRAFQMKLKLFRKQSEYVNL